MPKSRSGLPYSANYQEKFLLKFSKWFLITFVPCPSLNASPPPEKRRVSALGRAMKVRCGLEAQIEIHDLLWATSDSISTGSCSNS